MTLYYLQLAKVLNPSGVSARLAQTELSSITSEREDLNELKHFVSAFPVDTTWKRNNEESSYPRGNMLIWCLALYFESKTSFVKDGVEFWVLRFGRFFWPVGIGLFCSSGGGQDRKQWDQRSQTSIQQWVQMKCEDWIPEEFLLRRTLLNQAIPRGVE